MFFLLFRIINMELVGGGGGGGDENQRLHWSKVKYYTTVGNTNFLKVIRMCGGGGGELLGTLWYMVSTCLVLHTLSVFLFASKKRISRVLIFANDEFLKILRV